MKMNAATTFGLVILALMTGCAEIPTPANDGPRGTQNTPVIVSGTIGAISVDEVLRPGNPEIHAITLNNLGSTPIVIRRVFDENARSLEPMRLTTHGAEPSAHPLPVSLGDRSSVTFVVPAPQKFIVVEIDQGRFKWTSGKGWIRTDR